MSEEKMVEVMAEALSAQGIEDSIVAVGEFYPRGHTGAGFAGGMLGGEGGGALGSLGESVGTAGGYVAGTHAHDAATGLPDKMLVGVSATTVYGFAEHTRHSAPGELVFQLPRAGLEAKVHQRVNVRVLELIDSQSGSRIELEGNRLPVTHSKDVIDELAGS
jgi:hypothetical protein